MLAILGIVTVAVAASTAAAESPAVASAVVSYESEAVDDVSVEAVDDVLGDIPDMATILPLMMDLMSNVNSLEMILMHHIPLVLNELATEDDESFAAEDNDVSVTVVEDELAKVNEALRFPVAMLSAGAGLVMGDKEVEVHSLEFISERSGAKISCKELIKALACELEQFIFAEQRTIDSTLEAFGILLDELIIIPFTTAQQAIKSLIDLLEVKKTKRSRTIIGVLKPLEYTAKDIAKVLFTLPTKFQECLNDICSLILSHGVEATNSVVQHLFGPFKCRLTHNGHHHNHDGMHHDLFNGLHNGHLNDLQHDLKHQFFKLRDQPWFHGEEVSQDFVTHEELKRLEDKIDSILNWIV